MAVAVHRGLARTFATAEHFMMWSKAMLFGDAAAAAQVLTAAHPHRAKAIGRTVKGFDQSVWNSIASTWSPRRACEVRQPRNCAA